MSIMVKNKDGGYDEINEIIIGTPPLPALDIFERGSLTTKGEEESTQYLRTKREVVYAVPENPKSVKIRCVLTPEVMRCAPRIYLGTAYYSTEDVSGTPIDYSYYTVSLSDSGEYSYTNVAFSHRPVIAASKFTRFTVGFTSSKNSAIRLSDVADFSIEFTTG